MSGLAFCFLCRRAAGTYGKVPDEIGSGSSCLDLTTEYQAGSEIEHQDTGLNRRMQHVMGR